MVRVRRSDARGHASFNWLESRHTFSFGSYYDPQHMGYSALRVINDDRVVPGAGFGTHGHRDMEIISYVLEGALAHKDSEGNVAHLPPGEFQLMYAGRGITHSEFNASGSKPLRFLQIWILPNVASQPPTYQQKDFGQKPGLTLVASPDGADGSLTINQDARLYQLVLMTHDTAKLPAKTQRHYYVHVITGALELEGETLHAGDGAQVETVESLQFSSQNEAVRALVFDLP